MAPCAEILILFFDALMLDDEQLVGKMLRRLPLLGRKADTLTVDEMYELSPPSMMTNHFYTCKSSSTCVDFGVVLRDTAFARKLVAECKLEDFVYWGANTDPVQFATVFDIAEALETSEVHATPRKVLTVLREADSADVVKPSTDTPASADALAKLSAQRKRIMERRGDEDKERAKVRKTQDLEFDRQFRFLSAEILASKDAAHADDDDAKAPAACDVAA